MIFCECSEMFKTHLTHSQTKVQFHDAQMLAESLLVSIVETIKYFILIYYISQSYLSDSNTREKRLKIKNFTILRWK